MEVFPTPIVYSIVLSWVAPLGEGMIILGQGYVALLAVGIPFFEGELGNGFGLIDCCLLASGR